MTAREGVKGVLHHPDDGHVHFCSRRCRVVLPLVVLLSVLHRCHVLGIGFCTRPCSLLAMPHGFIAYEVVGAYCSTF
eukprot:scaffold96993_cov35-Tisochrysis_lutea.AAC.2